MLLRGSFIQSICFRLLTFAGKDTRTLPLLLLASAPDAGCLLASHTHRIIYKQSKKLLTAVRMLVIKAFMEHVFLESTVYVQTIFLSKYWGRSRRRICCQKYKVTSERHVR
jgi:hypothetical protein